MPKCGALAKKNPKFTTGIFFVFKMKTEKCSILIGPQDRFFKMKINGVAQALHRKARIQQFGQSAILGIFCSGLNQKLTHNPNFKFCLVLRFFFKFLNIPRGGGKNYFFTVRIQYSGHVRS